MANTGPEILAPQDRQSDQYCLSEMRYGEEIVEHVMGECPRIHHHTAQLPEPYLFTTNPLKALKVLELWKAEPDRPLFSQLGQLD